LYRFTVFSVGRHTDTLRLSLYFKIKSSSRLRVRATIGIGIAQDVLHRDRERDENQAPGARLPSDDEAASAGDTKAVRGGAAEQRYEAGDQPADGVGERDQRLQEEGAL